MMVVNFLMVILADVEQVSRLGIFSLRISDGFLSCSSVPGSQSHEHALHTWQKIASGFLLVCG